MIGSHFVAVVHECDLPSEVMQKKKQKKKNKHQEQRKIERTNIIILLTEFYGSRLDHGYKSNNIDLSTQLIFKTIIYYIHFLITGDPCNLIVSQQGDLFTNRTKSHLF